MGRVEKIYLSSILPILYILLALMRTYCIGEQSAGSSSLFS